MSAADESGRWADPVRIASITSFEHEESYASLTSDGALIYLRGRPEEAGGVQYDLFRSQFEGGAFGSPERHPISTDRWGEGDPWVARDESYLIFTRWDESIGWEETVDLYIAYSDGASWSEPVPLTELNSPGRDFGPAVSADGQWLHYRRDSSFLRVPLAPVLERHRPAEH